MANQRPDDDPCVGEAGRRATTRGQSVKHDVETMLRARELSPQRGVLIGDSIFGGKARADFYLPDLPQFPDGLIVQVRSQHTSGTADEKLPALVETIRTGFPCPVVMVLDGDGWREGVRDWMRGQVDGRHLLGVYDMEGFTAWASANL